MLEREAGRAALSRRQLMQLASAAAVAPALPAWSESAPDYRLEIAPLMLELLPRHRVQTLAYNAQVPGPLLRLREGAPVSIEVSNRSTGLPARVTTLLWCSTPRG